MISISGEIVTLVNVALFKKKVCSSVPKNK